MALAKHSAHFAVIASAAKQSIARHIG